MSYPNYILLVGKKQSGKTTAAKTIVATSELAAEKHSFGDELKRFCIDCGWINYIQAYGFNEEKDTESKLRDFRITNKYTSGDELIDYSQDKEKFLSAREVLQIIGTDIMRAIDRDIWINRLQNNISKSIGEYGIPEVVVIDDGRFQNEVERIKQDNGIVIYLERDVYKDNHFSEAGIDKIDRNLFDYIIKNQNFSEDQLITEVKRIAKEIFDKWK